MSTSIIHSFMSMTYEVSSHSLYVSHAMLIIYMDMLVIMCDQFKRWLWGHKNTLDIFRMVNGTIFVFMTWANFTSKSQFTHNVIFHDPTLTKVELQHRLFVLQCTLNKSCSLFYVEQTLFKGHELIQCLTWSNRAHKNQQNVVLRLKSFVVQKLFSVSM